MYTMIRNSGVRRALRHEAVPLVLSFAAAEMFYRFHSFTLECAAFLVTWCAISAVASALEGRIARTR